MSITIEIHDDVSEDVRTHSVGDGEVAMITVIPLSAVNPQARPDQFSVTILCGAVGSEVAVERMGAS